MELINCLGKDFDDACFNLASDIISDNYRVDIIVGIKKGGAIVSKKVYDYIKIKFPDVLYFEVQFQHPTTVWMKNIGIKKIFKYLPCWSLNLLRKIKMFIDEILWNLQKAECEIRTLSNGNQYYEIHGDGFGGRGSFVYDGMTVIINI